MDAMEYRKIERLMARARAVEAAGFKINANKAGSQHQQFAVTAPDGIRKGVKHMIASFEEAVAYAEGLKDGWDLGNKSAK